MHDARRRTMNSTEFPKLKTNYELRQILWAEQGLVIAMPTMNDPEPAYWFRFTPVGTSFLPHQGGKKGATLPHKPITPSQMGLSVCGLTAAPCPHLYEHRQSCPGVTQAVFYVHRFIHSTRKGQDWQGTYKLWRYPLAPKSPTLRFHTFVQPIDCLMSNPYPGDTNCIPGTSGWREGVTAHSLTRLGPVPGCLLGMEPATCPRTTPAGRKFTPASTSVTGSKSSAGLETPPLTLFVPVGPYPNRVRPRILCTVQS